MPISLFQIVFSNQLQISLELEIDISNAVIGLSNTDICNKRVLLGEILMQLSAFQIQISAIKGYCRS